MSNSARQNTLIEKHPAVAATTVGLSFFIGLMEVFVAVLAFAVAGRQNHPHAGAAFNWSNDTASRVAYAVAAASLLNSILAFGRARLRPGITAFSSVVFIATCLLVNLLFVRAW